MGRHEIWLLLFCSLLCNLQPSCQQAYNTMFSGDSLLSGQYLTFSNNVLTMQSDCNLVLKRGGISIWSSDTSGGGKNCTLKLQSDGNLLIYSQNNTTVWSTGSKAPGPYILIVQRDGNLVIYGPLFWQTRTQRTTS